jgi:hypothetical protein
LKSSKDNVSAVFDLLIINICFDTNLNILLQYFYLNVIFMNNV